MDRDIKERTFNFALGIISLSRHLPETRAGYILGKQLLRSGTSVGANVEEATAAYSPDDFTYKMNIALKEARETHYWLRLMSGSNIVTARQVDKITKEADEIMRILGAVVSKMRGKSKT